MKGCSFQLNCFICFCYLCCSTCISTYIFLFWPKPLEIKLTDQLTKTVTEGSQVSNNWWNENFATSEKISYIPYDVHRWDNKSMPNSLPVYLPEAQDMADDSSDSDVFIYVIPSDGNELYQKGRQNCQRTCQCKPDRMTGCRIMDGGDHIYRNINKTHMESIIIITNTSTPQSVWQCHLRLQQSKPKQITWYDIC